MKTRIKIISLQSNSENSNEKNVNSNKNYILTTKVGIASLEKKVYSNNNYIFTMKTDFIRLENILRSNKLHTFISDWTDRNPNSKNFRPEFFFVLSNKLQNRRFSGRIFLVSF